MVQLWSRAVLSFLVGMKHLYTDEHLTPSGLQHVDEGDLCKISQIQMRATSGTCQCLSFKQSLSHLLITHSLDVQFLSPLRKCPSTSPLFPSEVKEDHPPEHPPTPSTMDMQLIWLDPSWKFSIREQTDNL